MVLDGQPPWPRILWADAGPESIAPGSDAAPSTGFAPERNPAVRCRTYGATIRHRLGPRSDVARSVRRCRRPGGRNEPAPERDQVAGAGASASVFTIAPHGPIPSRNASFAPANTYAEAPWLRLGPSASIIARKSAGGSRSKDKCLAVRGCMNPNVRAWSMGRVDSILAPW
jgi:hypothetical protein